MPSNFIRYKFLISFFNIIFIEHKIPFRSLSFNPSQLIIEISYDFKSHMLHN